MKIPKSTDRRVRRTRRALREALIELTLERGWDDVSVLDVCSRADVGRSTFYTHFADKDEVLLSGFEELRESLRAHARHGEARDAVLGFVRGLFEHVKGSGRLFRALVGRRAGAAAHQQAFRKFVHGLVRDDLIAAFPEEPRVEASARYIAGGISELLIWSVDGHSAPRAAELDDACARLTGPILATLRRGRGRDTAR